MYDFIYLVKPANQRTVAVGRRGSFSRNSQLSSGSHQSQQTTNTSDDNDLEEQDEIVDLTVGENLEENSLINNKDNILHL